MCFIKTFLMIGIILWFHLLPQEAFGKEIPSVGPKKEKPSASLLEWYIGKVYEKVYSKWTTPLLGSQDNEVVVSFYVYPKGNIDEPVLIESAGEPKLDSPAMQAILDAEPLPKFPEKLKMANLHVTILFKYIPENKPPSIDSSSPDRNLFERVEKKIKDKERIKEKGESPLTQIIPKDPKFIEELEKRLMGKDEKRLKEKVVKWEEKAKGKSYPENSYVKVIKVSKIQCENGEKSGCTLIVKVLCKREKFIPSSEPPIVVAQWFDSNGDLEGSISSWHECGYKGEVLDLKLEFPYKPFNHVWFLSDPLDVDKARKLLKDYLLKK